MSSKNIDDECEQRLKKVLDAYTALQDKFAKKDAEFENSKVIIAKQDEYNQQLLEVIKMLISAEKRDKSFFRKLLDGLEKLIEKATDPKTLIEIAALIVIARNLSK